MAPVEVTFDRAWQGIAKAFKNIYVGNCETLETKEYLCEFVKPSTGKVSLLGLIDELDTSIKTQIIKLKTSKTR